MVSFHLILFVLVSLLWFKGVSLEPLDVFHYSRVGQNATLLCDRAAEHSTCPNTLWYYTKYSSQNMVEIRESPGFFRMSLSHKCSLIIHNVTDEDAGRYICRPWSRDPTWDTSVYLSVLTVSEESIQSGHRTIRCSLKRFSGLSCQKDSLRWLDTGTVLSGDRITQNNCVSYLTVDHQSQHNKKYTCEYVEKNNSLISADYTPEVRRTGESVPPENPGVSPERVSIHRFSRVGQDSTLPCDRFKHHGPTCSSITWLYNRDSSSTTVNVVIEGKVKKNSPRSSRLRPNTDCSLTVHDVTDEDSGLYTCRLSRTDEFDTTVYLNVLSVSEESIESGHRTIRCSLKRFSGHSCRQDSLRWLDDTGTVLSGITQNNCVSYLTVDRQSQHNKKYTCEYVDEKNNSLISADYTPEVRRTGESVPPGNPDPADHNTLIYISVGAVASLLLLLVVAVLVFFKIRSKRNAAETTEDTEADTKLADSPVDLENNVTYAMITHQKSTANKQQVMVEDAVTYSTVNITKRPDSDLSAIYSTVNKSKV